MAEITFRSAQDLYQREKYADAFEQFSFLAETKVNPAFSAFLAGNSLFLYSKKVEDTYALFTKALQYDDSNALINREIERFSLAYNLIDPQKRIVLHFFPNTPNIGDSGSAAGIRSCINLLTDECFFVTLSCRNDDMNVLEKYSSNCSGIILGGGGLYFQQPTSSGWYFPLTLQQLEMLDVPTVSFAVGFNQEYSDNAEWDINDSFISNIAHYNCAFSLKSVRDSWSKELLEKKGVSDLYLVPCPSALLKPLSWYKMPSKTSSQIIAINLTDRTVREENRITFFTIFFEFAKWLQRNNFQPLFIFQDSADDMQLATLIVENGFQGIVLNTAREAASIYSRCSFVIGMRGHSLILAAGQCVPMIAISYNKKVNAFMDLIDMKEHCIDQNDLTDQKTIIRYFQKLIEQKDEIITKLNNKRDMFSRWNKEYCDKIKALLEINE